MPAPAAPEFRPKLQYAPEAYPTLRNWSSTYNCSPELLFAPTSNEEVAMILTEAGKRGKKVRAVGLHQSPGPVWHSQEWLISTRHLRQTSFSPATKTAILGAGLVLRDINPVLASHGLALPTMGSLADVTIGAIFAGPDHGKIRTIKRGEELFNAVGAGVGALGIVTEVEWDVAEAFGLEVTMERCRLEDYLDSSDSGAKLHELARSREYVKLWYYPSPSWSSSSPNTVLWRAKRVPLPPAQEETAYTVLSAKLMHALHMCLYFITTYLFPALQPWLNAVMFWALAGSLPKTQTMRSYEAQYMDCGYNQLVNEWSAPLPAPSGSAKSPDSTSKPVSAAPAARVLRSLVELLASSEGRSIGMHAPIELRFSAVKGGGDLLLSPGASYAHLLGREENGEDLVMWYEPIVYRPFNLPTPSRYFRFFERFESILRSELGARPHWTKGHFPSSEADLACMFGRDRIQRWREIRDEVDPDQMFWHGWLEERVGSTEGRAEVGAAEKREGRWEDVMGQK